MTGQTSNAGPSMNWSSMPKISGSWLKSNASARIIVYPSKYTAAAIEYR